ncbi:MAG: flagellar hook capping FlgD N-terminal domain-containing protein [Burkholderiaceae bacterium]|jgi:flagellar basal-body rod modification protein FlgD
MSISATSSTNPALNNLGGFGASAATTGAKGAAKAGKAAAAGADASALGSATSAEDQSNRFLKLLVAQMSNQDPLNPMDSAQVTSQMAQISTVQGVQTLNKTVSGLDNQFTQLQTMQGAALVGHDVATDGNALRVDADSHKGDGGFELDSPATSVSVDILNPAGTTIGSVKLGPQGAGSHGFDFDVPVSAQGQKLSFRVNALNNEAPLDSKPFAFNSISAVSSAGGKLAVELDDGRRVDYADVRAFY